MKAKYLFLTLAGALALSASAQENVPTDAAQTPARKTAYARNDAGDNWFVTIQGGVSSHFFGPNEDVSLGSRINFAPSFSVGKWHSPFFGSRLQFNGGLAKTFTGADAEKNRLEGYYVGAHYDFMFDIISYFTPYRDERVFHLYPWIGMGYNYKFRKDTSNEKVHSLTANAGLLFGFRVHERVDIVLEAQASYNNMNLTPGYRDPEYNGFLAQVSAGLTFRLGSLGWDGITPMDVGYINDLNNQINRLRSENEELSKRPVSCPECPEVTVTTIPTVVNTLSDQAVLFRFDKAVVDADQLVTIYGVAEYAKENDTPITVIGYADPTGSADYNMKLSERRAKAVAEVLTEKYGVPSNLITIEWKGVEEQPYDTKNWNRVVIMRSK